VDDFQGYGTSLQARDLDSNSTSSTIGWSPPFTGQNQHPELDFSHKEHTFVFTNVPTEEREA